jgi:hypothetical protein
LQSMYCLHQPRLAWGDLKVARFDCRWFASPREEKSTFYIDTSTIERLRAGS